LLFFFADELRPFTIDAMLSNAKNNNGKNLNKENSQQQQQRGRRKIID
jgi:hypothetical protein